MHGGIILRHHCMDRRCSSTSSSIIISIVRMVHDHKGLNGMQSRSDTAVAIVIRRHQKGLRGRSDARRWLSQIRLLFLSAREALSKVPSVKPQQVALHR